MAEVTNELMYEILKSIQGDVRLLKDGVGEIRHEIVSLRLSR